MKANYVYLIDRTTHTMIIIDEDLGNMSVTNCIEDVVAEIEGIEKIDANDYNIMYRDSEMKWDKWNAKKQSFEFLPDGYVPDIMVIKNF